MDGLRDGHRDDPMPYGVDTIRLRISFPAAPVLRGYNGRAWGMRPLRGWTGGQAAHGDRAGMMAAGLDRTPMSPEHGLVTPVGQAGGNGEYGSERWRQALAGVGTEGGQFVKVASDLPAGPAPSANAANGEGDLTAQRPGDVRPAAAQAGASPQPSPGVEEHGRVWGWLHDHGLAQTKHERADLLRKAMGAGSDKLVVDGDGVPVNVEQFSDDEVIALGKKLMDMPFELPFIGPAASVDETAKPGGENPKGNLPINATGKLRQADPMPEASSPGARHYVGRVRSKTPSKERNTVILRGESIQSDVEAIRAGRAMRDGRYYVVGDRYYIVHENGTIYPVQGSGFVTLDRGAFSALRIYNTYGRTPATESILGKMGITPAQRQAAIAVGAGQ